jgi:hypothetical protein
MLGFDFSEEPKNLVLVEEATFNFRTSKRGKKFNTFDRLQGMKGKIQTKYGQETM